MSIFRSALLILFAASLAAQSPAQTGYRVIVNPANPVGSLSRAEANRLFLKRTVSWPNQVAVLPIDQERVSELRNAFSRDVHQKSADAVVSYWQTVVFSGRDVPPPVGKSDAEVIAFVRTNPGAIGYVSASAELTGVKVVPLR